MKQLSILAILYLYLNSIIVGTNCDDSNRNEYCPNFSSENSFRKDGPHVPCNPGFYRAAIFEHNRIDKTSILDSISVNLAIFEEATKLAANEGAEIIVFPEDGIFHSRTDISPGLQVLPEPGQLKQSNNNPCLQPELFESSILKNLSCLARENNIYVVANFGTKQECKPGTKVGDYQSCPERGFLALNTDVIIDSQGKFLRQYHKFNMFLEVFDKSPNLEVVHIDTPFGRFGVFTCFDMLFRKPAMKLVEDANVDTVLFPTWWFDELPILTAIQFQDAWSSTTGVNLLAANINRLSLGSIGSGIFAGNNSIYTTVIDDESRLLVATIPKRRGQQLNRDIFNSTSIVLKKNRTATQYNFKTYELLPNDTIYDLVLDGGYHERKFCAGEVCCYLSYRTSWEYSLTIQDRVILIVRDSPRPGLLNWYEQVCFIATLKKPHQKVTSYDTNGYVEFERLELLGEFSTEYVYPVAAHNSNRLVRREHRDFTCDRSANIKMNSCKLVYSGPQSEKIYAFGMYARKHELDQMPEGF